MNDDTLALRALRAMATGTINEPRPADRLDTPRYILLP